jgi:hypothetical protein
MVEIASELGFFSALRHHDGAAELAAHVMLLEQLPLHFDDTLIRLEHI